MQRILRGGPRPLRSSNMSLPRMLARSELLLRRRRQLQLLLQEGAEQLLGRANDLGVLHFPKRGLDSHDETVTMM